MQCGNGLCGMQCIGADSVCLNADLVCGTDECNAFCSPDDPTPPSVACGESCSCNPCE